MARPANGYRVAIVGATGVVGAAFLSILEERAFPVRSLRAVASSRSVGHAVRFAGRRVEVEDLATASFKDVDVAFFSAGRDVSRAHAPRAAAAGALVVDNSSAFRMDPDVPLVVPEVNPASIAEERGIIANPNCSTILLVVVLAPLEVLAPIRRVVCATYQAVSGSGAAALEELARQAEAERTGRPLEAEVYPKPIHGNVLPFVQAFGEDGLTVEEWKMVRETRRILDRPDLALTATCARVPVRRAHSEAVNVEFSVPITSGDVRNALDGAEGVQVVDEPEALRFPTPLDAEGRDAVLVGRIRPDASLPGAVDLWLSGDQLRKGAALNAVQIAEMALDGRRQGEDRRPPP